MVKKSRKSIVNRPYSKCNFSHNYSSFFLLCSCTTRRHGISVLCFFISSILFLLTFIWNIMRFVYAYTYVADIAYSEDLNSLKVWSEQGCNPM